MSFSVIIPLYNKESSVEDAVKSVLNQTCSDFEIIVVDNNSTDQGVQKVEAIHDPRIRMAHETKQGVSAARNTGIQLARFEHITFLDADDVWEKEHLSHLIQLISDYPDAGIWANLYQITETNGKVRACRIKDSDRHNRVYSYNNFFNAYNLGDAPIHTNTVCIPKKILMEFNCFDTDIHYGEDILLWMKIFLHYPVVINDYVGSTYQRNALNRSDIPVKILDELPVIKKFEDVYAENPELHPFKHDFEAFIAKHIFVSFMANIRNGSLSQARQFLFDRRIYALHSKFRLFAAIWLAILPKAISAKLLTFLVKWNLVK